jgi:hypothetical protein
VSQVGPVADARPCPFSGTAAGTRSVFTSAASLFEAWRPGLVVAELLGSLSDPGRVELLFLELLGRRDRTFSCRSGWLRRGPCGASSWACAVSDYVRSGELTGVLAAHSAKMGVVSRMEVRIYER